uniref:DoxX family protein n=1 Tax=Algoriphagus sp. TaxID=1872435 RepID=UPI0040473164
MKLQDLGLLLVRLLAGGMMLTHGIPKISRFFGEGPVKFADPFGLGPEISLGLAIFAEVGCSFLVMIGFKTRWATIPLMITMLVAVFYAHAADPFSKKELPLLFFTLFLSILISGGGRYSVDRGIGRGR